MKASGTGRPRTLVGSSVALVAVLATAACGPGGSGTERAGANALLAAASIETLNTFDGRFVEVDACPDTTNGDPTFGCPLNDQNLPAWGPDANLFIGADPADGSASVHRPNPIVNGNPVVPASATWIDWASFTTSEVANHARPDWYAGKDPSAFPQSDACIGSAQVLDKMDIVNIGFSNNPTFAYLAVQRAGNNGDAGYYWIFTKKVPDTSAQGACPSLLRYDIQPGDILLVGHYHPSSIPLLQAFKAIGSGTYDAVSAIDYTNAALWKSDSKAVIAAAVNSTPTAVSSAFGLDGMKNVVKAGSASCATTTDCLDVETFAEAAVYSDFFTGGSPCGATFYASVVTRASGSGGTSPDLKDLAGPYRFKFGDASATMTVTPTCGAGKSAQFTYQLSTFTGVGGISTATDCKWYLDRTTGQEGTLFASTCNTAAATYEAPAGTHTVTLVASDGTCTAAPVTASVTVNPPPAVAPDLTAACSYYPGTTDPWFGYSAGATGVQGTATYAWSFTGGYTGGATDASGSIHGGTVAAGTAITGVLTLYDERAGVAGSGCAPPSTAKDCCVAAGSDSVTPYLPITVSIAPSSAGATCSAIGSGPDGDAVKFTPTIGGGSGSYAYQWTDGSLGALTAGLCGTSGNDSSSCTVNPDDSTFCASQTLKLTVTDVNAATTKCSAATSNQNTYTKITLTQGLNE